MKLLNILLCFCFLAISGLLTSCLDGDPMNLPPGQAPFVEMTYNPTPSSAPVVVNTGLQYFAAQTLLLSPADEADTISFFVTLQGKVDKDVTFTLKTLPDALNDNYATDSLEYIFMKDDQYRFLNTTATIKAGDTFAEFKIAFYPPNINFTESRGLPITTTNDAGLTTSESHGIVYFHIIGNPIAGLYNWDFIRYSKPDEPPSGSPDSFSFTGKTAVFTPVNPTTIRVKTGYYDNADYIITFDNVEGVLSNFKVQIDPKKLAEDGDWTKAGISIGSGPTIKVEDNNTKFTLHYTTATRNVTDIYTLK